MIDPRTPVLVAGGQVNQRTEDGDPAREPVDLIVEAARRADASCGASAGNLLTAVDSVRVVSLLSWRYHDPGALVGERIGAPPRHPAYTSPGGNTPQSLVNRTCRDIVEGKADVVLIGGAEAWRTRMASRSHGDKPDWTVQDESVAPTEMLGGDFEMMHPFEVSRGIAMPVQVYPMFEQAFRHSKGRSIDDHLVQISTLWSRFSEVAATNPNAWSQRAYTPEEIRTPGPNNRWIGYPYPKLMNSNNSVEQGAALLLCSAEAAERLGVPREQWVFPHSGAEAHDTYGLSNRHDLHTSPAMRVAGRTTLELAGVGVDDVAHVDLYSCFPSAVEIAATEIGLPLDDESRPLTVTGGLTFAGGPWNNYVTHAIATMAERLRESPPGTFGLCTANGGFITKHAMGVYGNEPPESGFRWQDVQAEVDQAPTREAVGEHDGEATIESWTVMHDREGRPENGLAAVLIPDGRRTWVTTQDADALKVLLTDDMIGHKVQVSADGTMRL